MNISIMCIWRVCLAKFCVLFFVSRSQTHNNGQTIMKIKQVDSGRGRIINLQLSVFPPLSSEKEWMDFKRTCLRRTRMTRIGFVVCRRSNDQHIRPFCHPYFCDKSFLYQRLSNTVYYYD
jgi:hypothetical protein